MPGTETVHPLSALDLPSGLDLRLVVSDMDGSLLDEHGRLPAAFWPVLDQLDRRGITFCPASGRQYANLRQVFGDRSADLVCIAENGADVRRDGAVVSVDPLPADLVAPVIARVRELAGGGQDVGLVMCGVRSAHVERTDDRFLAQATTYYAALERVADLTVVDDQVLKMAVFSFGPAQEVVAPALTDLQGPARVLVSGQHWVDVMNPEADKGRAVRAVQDSLGIGPEHTMVFGDYLNDLGMLDAARWSVAMANAHPQVREAARYLAPPNSEAGVLTTLSTVLGLPRD